MFHILVTLNEVKGPVIFIAASRLNWMGQAPTSLARL